jgi:hypothetical protein
MTIATMTRTLATTAPITGPRWRGTLTIVGSWRTPTFVGSRRMPAFVGSRGMSTTVSSSLPDSGTFPPTPLAAGNSVLSRRTAAIPEGSAETAVVSSVSAATGTPSSAPRLDATSRRG